MLSKLSILIPLFLVIGCTKDVLNYSKLESFDDLNKSITRYSASIESRNVNWENLGIEYRSSISEEMTEREYFNVVSELLQEFRDPHIWLLSPFDSMYTIDNLGYEKNYDESIVSKYLLDLEAHSSSIRSAFINDTIGYLSCADFKGDEGFNNKVYASILTKFSNTKGIIIDLRVNDGGSVYNAQNLLNKLSNQRRLWHTTENRTLNGFDEKYEWYIEPDPDVSYSDKVIVLSGRYTISAGERFAMGAKLLDNITILGDTTANTQGSVMGREMLNGWIYTMTFEKCLSPTGVNYAGVGIPPDEFIGFGNSVLENKDYVLERAIELID